MIEINKNKLIPAVTANWGEIVGDIDSQKDLVEYIDERAGIAAWGSISGNISDQSDLMSTLGSYATQSWVESQGYLTSETLPSDIATQSWVSSQQFATESWVSDQGYLTSETLPSDIATQSWVESQEFATESWVSSQQFMTLSTDPLLQHNPDRQVGPMACKFITVPYNDTAANKYVHYISDGDFSGVYFYRGKRSGSEGYFYKFNESTFNFDFFAVPTMTPSRSYPLWKTPDGQFALGNNYLVDFTLPSSSGSYIAEIFEYDMGGQYYVYSDHKDNIVYVGSNCYMINYYKGIAYRYSSPYFFNSDVVYTTNCTSRSLPRYKTYVEGNCVYTSGGVMYRFVEDTVNQTVNVEALETPLYPLINGTVPESDRIHKIGDYYIYYIKPYVWKWKPGNPEWELLDFTLEDFSYHPCGVDYGEYMFGNGFRLFSQPDHDKLLVWNFTSSIWGESIYSSQEDYYDKIGFLSGYVAENRVKINTHEESISANTYSLTKHEGRIKSLETSVQNIEGEIGEAINTTNNILS